MLPVSLDCPFLIVHSVFSNVYLLIDKIKSKWDKYIFLLMMAYHAAVHDEYICLLMMAYRAAVHETTKVSPYELMFGRTINLPIDLVIGHPDSNYIVPE
jgi:hypothetical protein